MTTDLDIYRTANVLIREHGEDATLEAAQRADLTDADLTRADLFGANLTDANLADADLKDTDLTGANLTNNPPVGLPERVKRPEPWEACPEE